MIPYYLARRFYFTGKAKKHIQAIRLLLYQQQPPMQGDVGIGYKNGKLYDYLQKKYINEKSILKIR